MDIHQPAPGRESRTDVGPPSDASTVTVVALRHPLRWVSATIILFLAAWWLWVLVTTPSFQWGVVGQYLFAPPVIAGVLSTIGITVAAMVIGAGLGTVIAIMRLSTNPFLQGVSGLYVWFFRGTPTLLQLLFWFNLASVFPRLGLGFGSVQLFSWDTNKVMTPLVATLLGLGLNLAAYYSEIVRAGILSVDEGQLDATTAYGFSRAQTLWHVILPQAMRVIIPPTGNELIGLLKWSSLASVISFGELLNSVQTIYSRTFEVVPLLSVAAVWYLALTTVLSIGQHFIEKRFARGTHRTAPPSFFSQLMKPFTTRKARA
ncbi:MAG: polar amino acid transport system permease protein [Subtercola sp.]|nr:polar amino acid transport system permease protein [Subtercola sp.]